MSNKYVSTPIGFARTSKEPLDKYQVFSSIEDLIEYIHNGPWYVGQTCQVLLSNDNGKTIVMEYTLSKDSSNNAVVIPKYPDSIENLVMTLEELEYEMGFEINPGIADGIGEDDLFMLVYNYDYEKSNHYLATDDTVMGYNSEPYAFSILGSSLLYRDSYYNNMEFLIIVDGVISHKISQSNNPIKTSNNANTIHLSNATEYIGSITDGANVIPILPKRNDGTLESVANKKVSIFIKVDSRDGSATIK